MRKEQQAAQALLSLIGGGRWVSLSSYCREAEEQGAQRPAILEVAYSSRLSRYLKTLPAYVQGYFWPSGQAGLTSAGVALPYTDLQNLGFEGGSFDVILTHDALAFIEDLDVALAEMARVLRRGGACISIARVDWPMPSETVQEPPGAGRRLYATPDGSQMPMQRKLGADLADRMRRHGLRPYFRRMSFHLQNRRNFTVIGVKA